MKSQNEMREDEREMQSVRVKEREREGERDRKRKWDTEGEWERERKIDWETEKVSERKREWEREREREEDLFHISLFLCVLFYFLIHKNLSVLFLNFVYLMHCSLLDSRHDALFSWLQFMNFTVNITRLKDTLMLQLERAMQKKMKLTCHKISFFLSFWFGGMLLFIIIFQVLSCTFRCTSVHMIWHFWCYEDMKVLVRVVLFNYFRLWPSWELWFYSLSSLIWKW